MELIATTTFGVEKVVKRELENLGMEITRSEDGKITYNGNSRDMVKSNLWLRSADRVMIKMNEGKVFEFEDLFQLMKSIPWEEYIEEDGNFKIDCSSVKSKLSSVPACQSVAEKALVTRLGKAYNIERFSKSGAEYTIKLSILKDVATIALDTTGPGLHKRGYRTKNVEAPIKETLAAALIQLTFWREDRILVDPFCGSGTIPIEAAMIGKNIAPGLGREFAAEKWGAIDESIWKSERKNAYSAIKQNTNLNITGSDIDKKAIEASRENALNAGVDDCIKFERRAFKDLSSNETVSDNDRGIVITNIPYGERIGEENELKKVYKQIGRFFSENPTWSLFLITSDKRFEKSAMGRPADRRRKLYNGRIEVTYYQYLGDK